MPEEQSWVTQTTTEGFSTAHRPTSLNINTTQSEPKNVFIAHSNSLTPILTTFLQAHRSTSCQNPLEQFVSPNLVYDNRQLFSELVGIKGDLSSDPDMQFNITLMQQTPGSTDGSGNQKSIIIFPSPLEGQSTLQNFVTTPNSVVLSSLSNTNQIPFASDDKNDNKFTSSPFCTSSFVSEISDQSIQISLSAKDAQKAAEGGLQDVVSSTTMVSDSGMGQSAFMDDTNDRPTRPSSVASSSNMSEKEQKPFSSRRSIQIPDQNGQRLERKRARNRDAARKCRERKINLINSLQKQVDQLSDENQQLRSKLNHTLAEVERLKVFVQNHVETPCPILSQS